LVAALGKTNKGGRILKIGVALGGGGVRGLAHISVLEALDQLGLRPSVMAGTSMGAIIGALYASGISGQELKERVERHIILKDDTWQDVIEKRANLLKWVNVFSADFSSKGLLKAQGFFKYLFSEIQENRFEDLEIPLVVIAADYWTAEEVVFETGDLLPAVQASMAVPGVFAPVSIAGRVLVDGGVVNLVPYDRIMDRADLTIAVNVARTRPQNTAEIPNAIESVLGAFDIMQSAALAEKMKYRKPDIYVRPEIPDVRMLDVGKIEEVFTQTAQAVEEMKKHLADRLTELQG
jgi:NTE family protein